MPPPGRSQVSEALALSPSARMAGLAADDLIVSVYFLTLYALARRVPPEVEPTLSFDERAEAAFAPAAGAWDGTPQQLAVAAAVAGGEGAAAQGPPEPAPALQQEPEDASIADSRTITVLHGATALAVAAAICFTGTQIAAALQYRGGSITVITAITGAAWWGVAGQA